MSKKFLAIIAANGIQWIDAKFVDDLRPAAGATDRK